MSYDIIGYSYDADMYCVDCTINNFGEETISNTYEEQGIRDSEGNNIHPIFADTEIPHQSVCGQCLEKFN